MSAHPSGEASVPPTNSGDAVEDFADFLDTIPEVADEDDEQPLEGEDEPEAEEAEPDEDTLEDEDEPDLPAIDPPVSWGTDAKELFEQLPRDLQEKVAEREAQREKFVQGKAQEASDARRSARSEAEQAFADRQRQYASEIEFFASRILPQAPDPALANTDPMTFIQLNAQYQAGMAQHQQMMQRAQVAQAEAAQREQALAEQQIDAEAAYLAQQIPDWNDAAKRHELLSNVKSVAAELGYTDEAMSQIGAQDVLALRQVAEWKAKADRYSALQKSKMEKVRSAKQLPKAVKPGVAPTKGEISSTRAQAAWANVKGARSKEQQADAFADFLETGGYL